MNVFTFKCPNCGGELIFDPETQAYKCEYCQAAFTQAQIDDMAKGEAAASPDAFAEKETDSAAGAAGAEGEAVLYTCPSCGAEVVTDATTAATFCYYCHNPVTLSGRLSGEYLPDRIIPFKISRKQAEEKFFSYVKKKKFIPRAFFSDSQIEKLSGVYYPYWLVDHTLDADLHAEGTKVRVWRSGQTEYTERKYYDVVRKGEVHVNNLTRNALKKANRELVENVQPYQMQGDTVPFSMSYLSGFLAEKRDLERSNFEEELQNETDKYAQRLIKNTVNGYSGLNVHHNHAVVKKQKWDYCMLPVWVLTYRSRDKLYYFAMNGQTGRIAGKLPVDKMKLALTSGVLGAIVFIAGLVGGFLL